MRTHPQAVDHRLSRRTAGVAGALAALLSLAACQSRQPLPASVAQAASAQESHLHAFFDLGSPEGGPFPSDRFTLPDPSHNTGLRVNLPAPDCTARPSDCNDIAVLNELDGFSLEPRLLLPFDGPVDVASVTSGSLFLVHLGDTLPGGDSGGRVIGIDTIVWDTFTNLLAVQPDEILDEHTRYALVATKDIRGPEGKGAKAAPAFRALVDNTVSASTGDPALDAYSASLRDALDRLDAAGIVARGQVIAASVFTTQSTAAILEKIRDTLKAATPAPADFLIGPNGTRTVFARSVIRNLRWNRQMSATPPPAVPLSPTILPRAPFDAVPGAVGRVAFGKYRSPNYQIPGDNYIPAVGTRSGTPVVQRWDELGFLLYLPSGAQPAAGYPVMIYGHGSGTDRPACGFFAATLASYGFATIAMSAPGMGFGPYSTYSVLLTDDTSVTFPSIGRGYDKNGDGRIDMGEGSGPIASRNLIGSRDWRRQRIVDFLQLVRVIQVGIDVDGDGSPDLDASRIYYLGTSAGGNSGVTLLALDPDVRAGVFNVPSAETWPWGTGRDSLGTLLRSKVPSLLNANGVTVLDEFPQLPPYFHDNMPLRGGGVYSVQLEDGTNAEIRSPVVNTVPGALAIQLYLERAHWAGQAGDSLAFAAHLRRSPLTGVPAKPILIQFVYGDRNVPNPSTTTLIRTGDLADRTTFVHTNEAFAMNPTVFGYPHTFMQIFAEPALNAIALQAQQQVASFFAVDGTTGALDPFDGSQLTDPDGAGRVFEFPIGVLPVGHDYFP